MSSRRVKKGPGRRPLSARRQRFLQLREQGWSIRAAAREAGVARAFTTRLSGGRGGRNGLEHELRRLGIAQKNGKPNHPQTRGKVDSDRPGRIGGAAERTDSPEGPGSARAPFRFYQRGVG